MPPAVEKALFPLSVHGTPRPLVVRRWKGKKEKMAHPNTWAVGGKDLAFYFFSLRVSAVSTMSIGFCQASCRRIRSFPFSKKILIEPTWDL